MILLNARSGDGHAVETESADAAGAEVVKGGGAGVVTEAKMRDVSAGVDLVTETDHDAVAVAIGSAAGAAGAENDDAVALEIAVTRHQAAKLKRSHAMITGLWDPWVKGSEMEKNR